MSQLPYSLSRHFCPTEEVADDERQARLPASTRVEVQASIHNRTGKRQIITSQTRELHRCSSCACRRMKTRPLRSNLDILSCCRHQHGTSAEAFNEAIVLQHYEYELNVPLAALDAYVEDRHIADLYRLWTKATFCSVWVINPENLIARLSFCVQIMPRCADMICMTQGPDAAKMCFFFYPHTY
jgi:hypothetical protein